jgi:hypothetical protein
MKLFLQYFTIKHDLISPSVPNIAIKNYKIQTDETFFTGRKSIETLG